MYILRQIIKNKEKTFEYIEFNNKYRFNQIKYYISYIDKYRIFKRLFNDVTEDYNIFIESMKIYINNPRKIGNLFLSYINSVKKFEEKSSRELKKIFDYNFFKNILKEAHNNKAYNLVYNMRNYEEHISTPITTIESNINGYVKLFANIYSIRKELKETGWKKLLNTQFVNEEMIEINSYINESNNIDILFIKEILFSKRLHINNIEYRVGDIIMDNDIKYRCIFKKKDILSNKIIDQCFVPMCLDNKDIKYILDNV